MTSDAEKWLDEHGLTIDEDEAVNLQGDPEIGACALVAETERGLRVQLSVRPGASAEERTKLAEWAQTRIPRFVEHGPEPDGWQHRSDGTWQLWLRRTRLPDLD